MCVPFGDERDVEVGGDGHEAGPRKVTHTENLTDEGGPAGGPAVGVEAGNPDR